MTSMSPKEFHEAIDGLVNAGMMKVVNDGGTLYHKLIVEEPEDGGMNERESA